MFLHAGATLCSLAYIGRGKSPLRRGRHCRPAAGDVGVTEWLNVYTTGDYVGRWLWSRHSRAGDLSAPLIDERDVATGNDAYIPNGIRTGKLETLMNGPTEKDICLGAGAHTHYFDKDQEIVATAIDSMIVSRGAAN
jgi:hypothetical protein